MRKRIFRWADWLNGHLWALLPVAAMVCTAGLWLVFALARWLDSSR